MSISINITGDYCPTNRMEEYLRNDQYSILPKEFTKMLANADLNITNLECPVIDSSTPAKKFGPTLSTDRLAVDFLKSVNFNLVTLANNHIMDHGAGGLESTLSYLNKANIHTVGAGMSQKESRRPFLLEKNGVKLAIINIAENEFISAKDSQCGANPFCFISLFQQITYAKEKSNKIIVIVHGGNENYSLPSPRFRDTLRHIIEIGSDAVIAHHSHCVGGVEVFNGCPIFYGIGNFLFDGGENSSIDWCQGLAVRLTVKADNNIKYELLPFIQNYKNTLGLKLMEQNDRQSFLESLEEKNKVIMSDTLLEQAYKEFIHKVEKQYLHFLQPYTNRFLHKMYSLGFIPSIFKNSKKRMLYLNLIRCESHRDIILNLLKRENSHP